VWIPRHSAADAEYSDGYLYISPPSPEASVCGTPGGTCHHLAQLGGSVTATCSETAPPAMTGGMIADGTYVMSSATVYTSGTTTCAGLVFPTGDPSTLLVTAPCMQSIDLMGGAKSYALSASGSTLTLMEVCPNVSTSSVPYTASSSTFSELSSLAPGIDLISVFQKL